MYFISKSQKLKANVYELCFFVKKKNKLDLYVVKSKGISFYILCYF